MSFASPSKRLQHLFIVSSYLTYALAAAALVWSEYELVPWISVVGAAVGAMMIVAFLLEGKWSMPSWVANLLGLGILAAASTWVYIQVNRSDDSLLNSLPWPTSMVPVAGPVMLMLFVAKLLRPKTIDDHWGLQLIGLVCVGLGCTLADDGYFVMIMIIYVVSALWCLALFFLYRERLGTTVGGEDLIELPRHRQVLKWAMPIAVLALVGFFTMPRTEQIWQVPSKTKKLETGQSDDQSIDMNREGKVELDPEIAFEVYVENKNGQPKTDLPADQRWRGPHFRYYTNGNWQRNERATPGMGLAGVGMVNAPPPSATDNDIETRLPSSDRDDEFTLTYTVKSKIGQIPFLADPIYYPARGLPIVQVMPSGRTRPARAEGGDRWLRLEESIVPGRTRYRQVSVPAPPDNISHPIISPEIYDFEIRRKPPQLPRLKTWTDQLMERLVAQGTLSREANESRLDGLVMAQHYEQVARALEGHLARSGEYTYSLELGRSDPSIDPVEDFLFNTKSGHCNRFTTALALMLRTQGVPCQVVLGYRGADSHGDGRYDVRQCYAHSWVEVLVTRQEPAPPNGFASPPTFHWLVVDGTPAEAAAEANAVGNRWWSAGIDWRRVFKSLILNYTAQSRDEILQDFWDRIKAAWAAFRRVIVDKSDEGFRARIAFTLTCAVILLTAFLIGTWLARKIRSRFGGSVRQAPQVDFYRGLLSILARRGWKPAKGQTAREFADSLAPVLRQRAQGDEINATVRTTSDLFYRVRFGRIALNADERRQIDTRLGWLATALSKSAD